MLTRLCICFVRSSGEVVGGLWYISSDEEMEVALPLHGMDSVDGETGVSHFDALDAGLLEGMGPARPSPSPGGAP